MNTRATPSFVVVLVIMILMAIGPIFLMLSTSLRLNVDILSGSSSLIFMPTLHIAWNEFLLGNALSDPDSRTVPVTIVNNLTEYDIDWGVIMATGMLLAVPSILFTLLANR
jgi:ABC-type glycerol-3-phosphate transport system permease component